MTGPIFPPRSSAVQAAGILLLMLFFTLPVPSLAKGLQEKEAEKEGASPSAEQILETAAERQGGPEIARKLNNFRAEFETEYVRKEKGKVYYKVTRIFKFPNLLWTEKKHDTQRKSTIEVYDGEDGWLITPDGQITIYTDKPTTYKTDMENLEHDARLTKEMFRFFFIANLRNGINDLNRLSDRPVPRSGSEKPVYVLEGKTTGWIEGERTLYLKIYVDPEEQVVQAVQMRDLQPGGDERLFLFEEYTQNPQGVLVPARIKMFQGDQPEPEMIVSIDGKLNEDKEIEALIEFNVDVDPELFVIPGEE